MPSDTTWEYWGQELTWLTRAGDVKIMHGPAFFARTSDPPEYGIAEHLDYPDVHAEDPPIDDVVARFQVGHGFITVELHFTQEYHGDEFTGLSAFQVNPRAIGKHWELDHTRLGRAWKNLDVVMMGWGDYPIPLRWPCPTLADARIFARIYNRTAFANFGPMTAIPY